MNAISFSLYGAHPKYSIGALRNAILIRSVYPGWQAVVHVSGHCQFKGVLDELRRNSDVLVITHAEPESRESLFWRIRTAFDTTYERVLVRDCDSRLNIREADAVQEWIASGKPLHVMRDHPRHNIPMMGGMWGVCTAAITQRMRDQLAEWLQALRAGHLPAWAHRLVRLQSDQNYLNNVIWPVLGLHACVHDDRHFTGALDKRFRVKLPAGQFVGQQVTEREVHVCPK